MAFEIRTGPRGISAFWNGLQLSSAYDAEREAGRWAAELGVGAGALVFVAGDPWGLAAKALSQAGAKAVALLAGSAARPHVPDGVTAWAPEDGDLESYLHQILGEWGPDSVSWQVWPAFERQAPELALDWSRRFRDVFRMEQGTWLTYHRFGRRFWTNAVRNALDWQQGAALRPGTRPIVIAASGPSLEDSLPMLAANRNLVDLWALPSSFEVLLRRGLVPDACVATDGGYYAREHLQRLAGTSMPILASLSSAPDPSLADHPCLFFSQGLAIERQLLGALVPSYGEVPSQGTVAVTAMELALAATTGPVFVAGLDLSFRDLRAHAAPHTVDRRLLSGHSRLTPYEGLLADGLFAQAPVKVDGVRTAPALITYAAWFRSNARFSRQVYRVAPSPLRWNSMTEISVQDAAAVWRSHGGEPLRWSTTLPWPGAVQRRTAVERALSALLKRIEDCSEDDPWLVETARTGAPRELAEDFLARRTDGKSGKAGAALTSFVRELESR